MEDNRPGEYSSSSSSNNSNNKSCKRLTMAQQSVLDPNDRASKQKQQHTVHKHDTPTS